MLTFLVSLSFVIEISIFDDLLVIFLPFKLFCKATDDVKELFIFELNLFR